MQKQAKNAQELRRIGAAQAFCEARLALGRVTLSLTDLVKESGLSAIAAKRQLSRLRGKVVRISPRQPFFLIVSPEHRSMGAPPANWWLQDYFDWLGRPYYLALQSAASAFGSNPQALQVTQVMTDRPCRAIKVGRIQVKFFVKRGIERTPTQQPAGAVAPLCVSTPEATAFDLIRYATSIGGIERAAETIRPLFCRSLRFGDSFYDSRSFVRRLPQWPDWASVASPPWRPARSRPTALSKDQGRQL